MSVILTSCLTHEARITAPPAPASTEEGATAIGQDSTLTPPGPPEQTVIVSPMPLSVPVSAWRRDQDGVIYRHELIAQTPLFWWQRFPMDFATDMLPIAYPSEVAATIHESPITPRTRAELDREATEAGYGPAPVADTVPVTK